MEYKGYQIFVSTSPRSKYYALVDGKKVYFGDPRYQHYHDKLGHYRRFDHNDEKRRENFHKRNQSEKKKPGTAGWFASEILW